MSEEIDYMDYSDDYEVNDVYSSDGTLTYHRVPASESLDWESPEEGDVTYIEVPSIMVSSEPPTYGYHWPPPRHVSWEEVMDGVEFQIREPPKRAVQLLLLLLTKEARENLIGDLAEEFIDIQVKHGMTFARVWYWKQVAGSAWPLMKKAVRWGLLASIGEWVRRLI